MKAIMQDRYGSPDVLELREIPTPTVDAEDTVLVRVRAASVNALDWRFMRGQPYLARPMMGGLRKPGRSVPGIDVAGRVEAVGQKVTEFRPGDAVFGFRPGSFAEYVSGKERNFAPLPKGLSFEQAAAVPVAAFTALQGLRDVARVRPGQRVLINGSSGGVGSYAVQIAKAFGADVTAVCGSRSVDLVRSLGADRVIDRTKEDFLRDGQRYDALFDVAADRPMRRCVRVLTPDGILVLVGAAHGAWIAPLVRVMIGPMVIQRFVKQRVAGFMARNSKEDLLVLTELIEAGKVRPVIDRTFPLAEAAAAIRYVEEGRVQGKAVITI